MKFLASITALILSACAHASPGVAVPPPSDFVDTEAATNVVFDAGDIYARRLDFALELNAAASNSVIVAWGFGANTNGVLERYYRSGISMAEIVGRMLMLGEVPEEDIRRDISAGNIYGVYYTEGDNQTKIWHKDDAPVGFPWSSRSAVHQ